MIQSMIKLTVLKSQICKISSQVEFFIFQESIDSLFHKGMKFFLYEKSMFLSAKLV